MDMMILNEETTDWFEDYPHCHAALLSGYREAISDMTGSVLTDPRSKNNSHILNNDFVRNPMYFIGFEAVPEKRLLILSCLYVFPGHRKKGYGSHLIDASKLIARDRAAIQVAVEKGNLSSLSEYYVGHGFKTTGVVKTNFFGKSYIDFFWSASEFELMDTSGGTNIKLLADSVRC